MRNRLRWLIADTRPIALSRTPHNRPVTLERAVRHAAMATGAISNDFDGFWKATLESYLRELLALAVPELHDDVDWNSSIEPLDKELLPQAPDAVHGRRFVDRLVSVRLHRRDDVVLLVHVEVQGTVDGSFGARMFAYWSRLRDRYAKPVVSLAVLADDDADWRPTRHEVVAFSTRLSFDFPVLKLLDLLPRVDSFERSGNPILVAIAIDLQARRSRPDEHRLHVKTRMLRAILRDERLSVSNKQQLFRLLTWLLRLPDDLEAEFDQDLKRTEARRMEIWSPMELRAIAKGRLEDTRDRILQVVQQRFGSNETGDDSIRSVLAQLDRKEALDRLFDAALTSSSRDAFVVELSHVAKP